MCRLALKNFPSSFSSPYSCQKPRGLQTLPSKLFLFIKTASPLYSALTFNDKFLHRPENDQRGLQTSLKSWKSQLKTHPVLTFSPFLPPPFFRKKARSTVQTSLSSICEVIRLQARCCKVTQTLLQICGSLS